MALLHESVEAKKFDTRMIERNVARGVIHQEDASKAAAKLPDDGDNAEWVSIESLASDESEGSNGHSH